MPLEPIPIPERSPTLIEPVSGTITLCDLVGAKYNGTKWEIAVGAIVTPWYEVTVER